MESLALRDSPQEASSALIFARAFLTVLNRVFSLANCVAPAL